MKAQLKKLSKMLRRASKRAKKGVRSVTRRVKKFFSRGGDPNAAPAPATNAAPAPAPNVAPAPKPRSRKHRKSKGPFRRVTNVVRRVGKRFRNTLTRVFSKKTKHRRRNKKAPVQQGSSENMPVTNATPVTSPGVPAPAPTV